MNLTLHAPQLIMLAMMLLSLGLSMATHGNPRTGNYNAWHSVIGCSIQFALMYWGGFFS